MTRHLAINCDRNKDRSDRKRLLSAGGAFSTLRHKSLSADANCVPLNCANNPFARKLCDVRGHGQIKAA